MRKIASKFEEIWAKAEKRNEHEKGRFAKLLDQNGRYMTMGIYDTVTKKYCIFNTINLVGNYRYDAKTEPPEFREMAAMLK